MSYVDMRQLPQTQSILTPLLWTVVLSRHNSLLVRTPWYLISTQYFGRQYLQMQCHGQAHQ